MPPAFPEAVDDVIDAESPAKMPKMPFPDATTFEITTPSELFAYTP